MKYYYVIYFENGILCTCNGVSKYCYDFNTMRYTINGKGYKAKFNLNTENNSTFIEQELEIARKYYNIFLTDPQYTEYNIDFLLSEMGYEI